MVSLLHHISANHEELLHDSRADFYGTRLATCGGDHKIKIFEISGNNPKHIADLTGHDGPVWQLDWSHPEHGNLLASCSYDRKVIIWKEINGKWEKIKEHKEHDSSVNAISWAPREFGLMLACASSDQSISILRFRNEDQDWESRKIPNAHNQGVNAVSWSPPISSVSTSYRPNYVNTNRGNDGGVANSLNSLNDIKPSTISGDTAMLSKPAMVERLVSGGCDHLVKVWKYDRESDKWSEECQLEGHSDWVRDVSWAPSIGLPKWYIASCGQDKKVIIWTNSDGPSAMRNDWEQRVLAEFEGIVYHVSWSLMGNTLAVSYGDNRISLWREDLNGDFKNIADVTTAQSLA